MDSQEPVAVYAASCRGRRVSPVVVVLCVVVLLMAGLSRTELPSRLRQAIQLARTPPTSPIRYGKEEAERLVRADMLQREPNLVKLRASVSGPWTEFPVVARGRPVFVCAVFAVSHRPDGSSPILTPLVLVDASTGEILHP